MRISDVEKQTGVTRKTIRFYEAKGLLTVSRSLNSYRDYNETVVSEIRQIIVLRKAGVGLSDIQLWRNQVISYPEMINKRLYELRNEADTASDQISLCRTLLDDGLEQAVGQHYHETFTEVVSSAESDAAGDLSIGIDIGTTTISAAVLSLETARAVSTYTINSEAGVEGSRPWERMQDAEKILDRVEKLLRFLTDRFHTVRSIGFSGQMHGILYYDSERKALSPLFTWQDERAGQGNPSPCARIAEETGYQLSPGYGIATHVYNVENRLVPEGAVGMCTIMDFVAAVITGLDKPVTHSSNAASLGLYRMESRDFDAEALRKLDISREFLPEVTDSAGIIGLFRGIPVSVPIGDNQASFIGAVRDSSMSALANIGTGSQISMLLDPEKADLTRLHLNPSVELRPFNDGKILLCGSALCGGRAYAMLERFFRSYLSSCGLSPKEQYETMNALASDGLRREPLSVVTSFSGRRDEPNTLGSIYGISENNFTPAALIAGFILGMARELEEMFRMMPHGKIRTLVVSGNAARKNPALREALRMAFGLEIVLPDSMEEAACGAAIFSARASAQISYGSEPNNKPEQNL